jgi:4-amino-4-deoxy-L-arabinose transferase-like glycosyltransferase/streptogramin lyase
MKKLLLVALALLIAILAQRSFRTGYVVDGVLLYVVAALCFVWQAPRPPAVELGEEEPPLTHWRRIAILVALVMGAVAAAIFWRNVSSPLALALWLVSLGLLVISVLPSFRSFGRGWRVGKLEGWKLEVVLLTAILLVALVLRVYQIDTFPNGCQSDEGNNGLDALRWLGGAPYTPYAETNEGQATLFTYLIAFYFRLFGVSVPAMRLVSATCGTLTVLAFYVLAREFYGPRVGLAITALLAASRWHLTFSRIVYEAIMVPLCEVLLFYFLWRGLRDGQRRDFVLGGLSLALGLNTYTAFRVVPVGLVLYAAYWLIVHRERWRRTLRGLGWMLLSTALGLVPLAVYWIQHPRIFMGRTQHISLLPEIAAAGNLSPLWANLRKVLLMFNYQGDAAPLNNLPGAPLLDFTTSVLFILGLAVALRYWRHPRFFLLLAWGFTVLPAAVFSVGHEAPSARRAIGLIPVLYLLVGLALERVWHVFEEAWRGRGVQAFTWALGLSCAAIMLGNANTYFRVQARNPAVWAAYSASEAAIGEYLAALDGNAEVYLDPHYDRHSAILLIGREPQYTRLNLTAHLPLREDPGRDVVYVLGPVNRSLRSLFVQFYPTGQWQEHVDRYGQPLFITFAVGREELAAMHGLVGRFYASTDWTGPAVRQQRDAALDFDWRAEPPLPSPFSAQWQGALFVPAVGEYAFKLEAGGQTALLLDGEEVLAVDDEEAESSYVLVAGFHNLTVQFVAGDEPYLRLRWRPPGAEDWEDIPADALYSYFVPENGLIGYYHHGTEWQGTPVSVQRDFAVTANDDAPFSGELRPPYSVVWRGKLDVPRPGQYALGTNSDDGSYLFVDGQLVVDNGGEHGGRYREGVVHLSRGYHDIEVRYFQVNGSQTMQLWWTPPSGSRELLPPTQLFPWEGEIPAHVAVQPPEPTAVAAGEVAGRLVSSLGGPGSEDGEFLEPRGAAMDGAGRVFVADTGNRRVQLFGADGQWLSALGMDADLQQPCDLAVDSRGTVYVVDALADAVVRLAPDGRVLARFTPGFYRPRGVAVGPGDVLYVADTGHSRVLILSADGQVLAEYVGAGAEPFDQPTDVAVDDQGTIYVVDTYHLRMVRMGSGGEYEGEWVIPMADTLDGPHVVVSAAGIVYVTDPQNGQVVAYDAEGQVLGQVAIGPGSKPVGVAVGPAGQMLAADAGLHRVHVFQP